MGLPIPGLKAGDIGISPVSGVTAKFGNVIGGGKSSLWTWVIVVIGVIVVLVVWKKLK